MQIALAQMHYFWGDLDAESITTQKHYAIESAIAETSSEWFRVYEPLKWD